MSSCSGKVRQYWPSSDATAVSGRIVRDGMRWYYNVCYNVVSTDMAMDSSHMLAFSYNALGLNYSTLDLSDN